MIKVNFSAANFIKNVLRIVISAIIGIIAIKRFDLNSFTKIILFFGIYIVVSLALEPIFKKIKK